MTPIDIFLSVIAAVAFAGTVFFFVTEWRVDRRAKRRRRDAVDR